MSPDLTRLTRYPDRGRDDRASLDGLLDDVLVGVLSTVLDGEPWSVPLLFARDGDRVILHGSTGAGALRHAAAGAPVTFTVHATDALVAAWDAFESSANYRSAVLRGRLEPLVGGDADLALRALTDRLLPGRTAEVPPSTRRELAATSVLTLPIADGTWLYKERTGGSTPPASGQTDVWTGVIPLRTVAGPPQPDGWNEPAGDVPASVRRVVERLA